MKLLITEQSGRSISGHVYGSGGVIEGDMTLKRTRHYVTLANAGEPLPIEEPRPGHCKVVLQSGEFDAVEIVDLRGALVERVLTR